MQAITRALSEQATCTYIYNLHGDSDTAWHVGTIVGAGVVVAVLGRERVLQLKHALCQKTARVRPCARWRRTQCT